MHYPVCKVNINLLQWLSKSKQVSSKKLFHLSNLDRFAWDLMVGSVAASSYLLLVN